VEKPEPPHSLLTDVLERTLGVPLYQFTDWRDVLVALDQH
jgi:hypothetical protein